MAAIGFFAVGCEGPYTPPPEGYTAAPPAPPIDQIDRMTPPPGNNFVLEGGAWEPAAVSGEVF
jgi:hypothetical protein